MNSIPNVPGPSRRLFRWVFVPAALVVGLWVRSLPPMRGVPGLPGWRLWTAPPTVTLYFVDGQFFFPVSRHIPANNDVPRAVLQALLNGPNAASGLTSPLPRGVEIRSFRLSDGVAWIDLSAAVPGEPSLTEEAETAIVETMTALPGVDSVALRVEGEPVIGPTRRPTLLYYASANGLVAVPVADTSPRAAIHTYLAGPPDPRLSGLPSDVRLLNYAYRADTGLVSLNFSYTSSVRALALDQPERVRSVHLGLIASLTEFAGVRAVQLAFEGHTRLGLGQCSDLLGAPQPRPELLNDERLLGR